MTYEFNSGGIERDFKDASEYISRLDDFDTARLTSDEIKLLDSIKRELQNYQNRLVELDGKL
jgi:hypothetical protein